MQAGAIPIGLFAHNEAANLARSIASIKQQATDHRCVIHVLENGSTDNTLKLAQSLADSDPDIKAHCLEIGDKANAWNVFIHEIVPDDAPFAILMDGDVRMAPGAIDALRATLEDDARAFAAAALPVSGRSQAVWRDRLMAGGMVAGALYAVRGQAIAQIRKNAVRMPIGFIGEDGLVGYFFCTDLKGGKDDQHGYRIKPAPPAGFEFDPLNFSPAAIKLYWRRRHRYSLRYFQDQLLYRHLKAKGIAAMPRSIDELYTPESLAPLAPRQSSVLDRLIDKRTLDQLRA